MSDQDGKMALPGATKRIEPSTEMMARIKEKQAVKQEPPVEGPFSGPGGMNAGIAFPAPKMSWLFKILLVFSYLFLAAGLAVGIVAVLDIAVPGFMVPVVNFIGRFFVRPA